MLRTLVFGIIVSTAQDVYSGQIWDVAQVAVERRRSLRSLDNFLDVSFKETDTKSCLTTYELVQPTQFQHMNQTKNEKLSIVPNISCKIQVQYVIDCPEV
ncbi:hypothetical protein DPMN_169764 [Dreissena polymorpha]|uniref:Uncharacterized protein n=1 Tax=Dreissena polymorpha TaxID=45954 RepID=A0A9D4DV70_DREPO|nr:hypothetical protein DPMN_169764 [Dreissena polymorpha]